MKDLFRYFWFHRPLADPDEEARFREERDRWVVQHSWGLCLFITIAILFCVVMISLNLSIALEPPLFQLVRSLIILGIMGVIVGLRLRLVVAAAEHRLHSQRYGSHSPRRSP